MITPVGPLRAVMLCTPNIEQNKEKGREREVKVSGRD